MNKQIKHFFSFLPLLATLAIFSGCDKDSDTVVPESELPAQALSFIATHFAGQTIAQVVEEKERADVSYDVKLTDSTKLEFTSAGTCTSIESAAKLPDSVVPAEIRDYVTTNYSPYEVRAWELEKNDQEVKLTNGVELKFDLNNNFLRVDD
ncbi:hypothetical protein FVR03_08135 [Pontibacter qinzhouensis]|uniref:Putative beta-lactamase-inhibitor-like PepSY-like domain-containing protein n=1 Tax=Pontibacter qinzhouensis TaxID=2603253 RepID=A0A5C8K7E0_9BACT|nr:PepSY-like domain-containing protein [Pontibacter qinzhouensis]TXK48133.1 hypothetical protein FVR03_08135 [Pontibacter qinzhouensis]